MNSIKYKTFYLSFLVLLQLVIYQWTVNQPFMGDALMHSTDDTQLQSTNDIIKTFYLAVNPDYNETNRISGMHRPVFNELLITLEKSIFQQDHEKMRMLSLVIQIINTILIFFLIYLITKSNHRAFVSGLFFSLNTVYFYGLYEFGLSFSIWLTFFTLLTFIFMILFIMNHSFIYFVITMLFCFLTIFTKESAMPLPAILTLFALAFNFKINLRKKVNLQIKNIFFDRKIISLSIGYFSILSLYLVTRYLKLGAIFEIHAGIGTSVSVSDLIQKFIAYFLLAFNISINPIPNYMAIPFKDYNMAIQLILGLFILLVIIIVIKNLISKNIYTYIGLLSFFILLAPVAKVSRNAPYYLDISLICIVFMLSTLSIQSIFKKINIKRYHLLLSAIVLLIINNIYFQYKTLNSQGIWLTSGQSNAEVLYNDLLSLPNNELQSNQKYLLSSFYNSGDYWVFNHGKIGSFLSANLGVDLNTVSTFDKTKVLENQGILLDFYYETDSNPNRNSNLNSQIVTNVRGIDLVESHDLSNVQSIMVNEEQLIEIKGSLKDEVDITSIPLLNINFSRRGLLPISKNYDNNSFPFMRDTSDDLSIYTLVPKGSYEILLELPQQFKESFKNIQLNIYDIQKKISPNELINEKAQIVKDSSFEEGTSNWINIQNHQIDDSKSGEKAVLVGPGTNNSIHQELVLNPGKQLLITGWIKSVNSDIGQGRLQINWINDDGTQFDAFIEVIEVSSEYQLYKASTTVPDNISKGILYVTPHDETSTLIFDDVKVYQEE